MIKFLMLLFLAGLMISCGTEVIPDRDYVTKKQCLEEEIEERGDWNSLSVLDSYENGEVRKVKVIWDINEIRTNEYGSQYTLTEYYYILWNNTDIHNWDWEYGWNILNGPTKSN